MQFAVIIDNSNAAPAAMSFIIYNSTSQLYHGLQRVYGLQITYTLEAHDT